MTATFPIYRKYPHNKTFFKITSASSFEQLEIIGDAYQVHKFVASVYPDRLLILDMLEKKDGYWLESSAQEYEDQRAYCMQHLRLL